MQGGVFLATFPQWPRVISLVGRQYTNQQRMRVSQRKQPVNLRAGFRRRRASMGLNGPSGHHATGPSPAGIWVALDRPSAKRLEPAHLGAVSAGNQAVAEQRVKDCGTTDWVMLALPTSLPAALGSDLGWHRRAQPVQTALSALSEAGAGTIRNPVSCRRTKWCHWHHLVIPEWRGFLVDFPIKCSHALRDCRSL